MEEKLQQRIEEVATIIGLTTHRSREQTLLRLQSSTWGVSKEKMFLLLKALDATPELVDHLLSDDFLSSLKD